MATYLLTALINSDGYIKPELIKMSSERFLTNNAFKTSAYGITDILEVTHLTEEMGFKRGVTVAGVENKTDLSLLCNILRNMPHEDLYKLAKYLSRWFSNDPIKIQEENNVI